MIEEALERSRRELAAAKLLADNGFGAQAVSRSYFAAFYAAEDALSILGETRAKHSGVISAFGRIVVREHAAAEDAGRLLRSLFERRSLADYRAGEVPVAEARVALRDANVVVDAVQAWLGRDGTEGDV